jgi:hypothetical protein
MGKRYTTAERMIAPFLNRIVSGEGNLVRVLNLHQGNLVRLQHPNGDIALTSFDNFANNYQLTNRQQTKEYYKRAQS